MSGVEYGIQRQNQRGQWVLLMEHYSTFARARRELERLEALGPYPNGKPREPLRLVSRPVLRTWKPVDQ